ncbi:hypothetical protein GCM10011578_049590 [Streptomyces fuscichromogenes]|uniref:Uncharacterized protein n=2 Tax=Streptomyces fuscichromogenes TaxID=1324013 RepID=A0A917XGG6_9ACTN|nr:hypothetical protein GCM10011578_049590 [Streptomyces fuscichromogenes]
MRPQVSGVHGDSGNTKTYDGPAPLGAGTQVKSMSGGGGPVLLFPLPDGRMTAAPLDMSDAMYSAITAVDPTTMAVKASWSAPEGQQLNGYMYQKADGEILATTKQGRVYVLQRTDTSRKTTITLEREIDLASMGVLGEGESLHSAAFDTGGGIWFVTGAITGVNEQTATTTTVGRITEDGQVRTLHLKDQVVENGFAVKDTTAYVVTGPAGDADHANAKGHFYAFGPGTRQSPRTLWDETYDAGSGGKLGGLTRGSGTTPTVLGSQYVAIADNADGRSGIRVYRQQAVRDGGSQLVCSVPLGTGSVSSADNGMIGYVADGVASIVAQDTYGQPAFFPGADINGSWNDDTGMTGGMQRVDVTPGGRCVTKWTNPVKMRSVPVLSTSTGLVYGSAQDPGLAAGGTYVWYAEAIDFGTGKTVWKQRVGAGGSYNDVGMILSLGPDGTLYDSVRDGVVAVKDRREP